MQKFGASSVRRRSAAPPNDRPARAISPGSMGLRDVLATLAANGSKLHEIMLGLSVSSPAFGNYCG
ncbi:hypothetical protein [Pseudomonas lopnurensis]|uniref:hypothetical protein n=1 Tax=Pseudomonas lopnurensis TaxID=1477517 RepID=UPI0018790F2D|nr:hypothetical protein [Pseudomonas lopnurensis]MBE7376662.1 hypothetical protein [Pseudomonas lopnurensis]